MAYSNPVKDAILRIEYPDKRCVHRTYATWERALAAKKRILSNCEEGVRCHVYKLSDEVSQISLFEKEEPDF